MTTTSVVDTIVAELEQVEARRQAKIAQFTKLLRDPDITSVVQRVLSKGHLRKLETGHQRKVPSHKKDGGGIREAIRGLSNVLPKHFTTPNVLKALEAKHFKFGAKDRKGAVRDAVAALREDGIINVVQPAQGEKPQVYEFAEGEQFK